MKESQKQWQLHYLGFYGESTGDIDGDFGPKSKAGTEDFQKTFGLEPADGIFGKHTRNKSKEIISAIQEVVSAYAKEPLKVDGLAGVKTMTATIWFQKAVGLTPTGIADADTREAIARLAPPAEAPEEREADWWKEIRYFTREEWRCKCAGRYCGGYPAEPQEALVRLLDRAREHFGKPCYLVSPLRCETWNRLQGGVANSRHRLGKAADIRIPGVSANNLYSWLRKQPEVRYTYKITSTNVHVDIL